MDDTVLTIPEKKPQHIAIIMDGNGRWAKKRGLPRSAGHRAGTENLRSTIESMVEFGIPYMTIYAFSTENWDRPSAEVEGLMHILEEMLESELKELHKNGVRLRHIGHLDRLEPSVKEKIQKSVELTKDNDRLTLCIAWNYGGRDEILCAVRQMVQDGVKPEEINDDLFSNYLFTAGMPDPDLLIRTSGEMRISNFLIWQSSYAEWYITQTLWPDFNRDELLKALISFSNRNRRYGKIADCPEDSE